MNYTVENGVIKSENGVPFLPRWFAEDRVAFGIDKDGIIGIDYWNKHTEGSEKILYADFWGGIKPMIQINHKTYLQNLQDVQLYPFGLYAVWDVDGRLFAYKQIIANQCIVISITPQTNTEKTAFKLSFYDSMRLEPHKQTDIRYVNPVERVWSAWEIEAGKISCFFQEKETQTAICIGTNRPNTMTESRQWSRHLITCESQGEKEECIFVIALDQDMQSAKARADDALHNYAHYEEKLLKSYAKIQENMPVFKSGNQDLDNFMAFVPMYCESLKIRDYPGAVRANTTYYWVWGWDGITSNYATVYHGDLNFIQDLLNFYMHNADPKHGIPHAFSKTMNPGENCALATQPMYVSLLYLYLCNGGNISPYYEFAKKIFNLVCDNIVGNTGLFCERSLFPDYPENMLETGNDISGFNNTVFYCGARAMEILAEASGDKETAKKAYTVYTQIEESFARLFFDAEKGYIVSSLDAETLTRRNCYNANSIKWENNFCAQLTADFDQSALHFFAGNIVTDMGLREIPVWCEAYDTDANQLHCWWPVTGEYFARLINKFYRTDLIEQWIRWVSVWTSRLLCPEGISCLAETPCPDLDGWNCQSGTWQAYSMRAWYEACVHAVIGVDFDFGGITVQNSSKPGVSMHNLHWKDALYDIIIEGEGAFAEEIIINGKQLRYTNVVPTDMTAHKNEVKIVKSTQETGSVRVITAYGMQLNQYEETDDKIQFTVSGYGHQRILLFAKTTTNVTVEGITKTIVAGDNWIDLDFTDGREKRVCVQL